MQVIRVQVTFLGQLGPLAGNAGGAETLPAGATLADLLKVLAAKHDPDLARLVQDEQGRPRPSLLVFLNGARADPRQAQPLPDGSQVMLLTPIGGG